MVDVKEIVESYRCGKCGKDYKIKSSAEECCEKKVTDWEDVDEFELKQVHLDLLKEANIHWWDCEFGAPCVDPKRPYGNSNVLGDMAEILKIMKKDNYDYVEGDWKEDKSDYMADLHKQTQVAIEIILQTQSFKLGTYKRKDGYGDYWELIE